MNKIAFLCVLLSTSSTLAWTTMLIQGQEAQITNSSGQKKALKLKDKISTGDLIETQNSRVKLVESGSVLIIAENSSVKIADAKTPALSASSSTVDLLKGKVRAKISKEVAPKYIYKIPSAVAGIRGTEFFMSASTEKEVICVLEGEVQAQELIGEKRNAALTTNKGWIREGSNPPVIVDTEQAQRDNWIKATDL